MGLFSVCLDSLRRKLRRVLPSFVFYGAGVGKWCLVSFRSGYLFLHQTAKAGISCHEAPQKNLISSRLNVTHGLDSW